MEKLDMNTVVRWDVIDQEDLSPDDFRGWECSKFRRNSVRLLSCLHLDHRSMSGLQANEWMIWNRRNTSTCVWDSETSCSTAVVTSSDRLTVLIRSWDVEELQRSTLTVDSNQDVLFFGILATADAACVQASVWALELRDGQNIVEQHVRSMFYQPFGGGADVVILKVEMKKELLT